MMLKFLIIFGKHKLKDYKDLQAHFKMTVSACLTHIILFYGLLHNRF